MNDKLRAMSDRIENTGSMGSNDEKVVFELADKILVAVADRKVSGKTVSTSDLDY